MLLVLLLDLGFRVAVGFQSAGGFWNDQGEVISRRMDTQRIQAGIWGYGLDAGYVDWGVNLQGMCVKLDTLSTCRGEWIGLQYSRALPLSDQMILLRTLLGWDLFQRPYALLAHQGTADSVLQRWLDLYRNFRQGAALVGLSTHWLFPSGETGRFLAGLDFLMNFPESRLGRETRLYGFLDGSLGEAMGAGLRVGMASRLGENLGTWVLADSLGDKDTVEIQIPSTRVFYVIPYIFLQTEFGEVRLWFGLPGRIPFTLEGPGYAGMGVARQAWGLSLEIVNTPLFREFRRGRWR